MVSIDEVESIDIAIDGADEVDPELQLIKGKGAALLREKSTEILTSRFVVIVDESKIVKKLGNSDECKDICIQMCDILLASSYPTNLKAKLFQPAVFRYA